MRYDITVILMVMAISAAAGRADDRPGDRQLADPAWWVARALDEAERLRDESARGNALASVALAAIDLRQIEPALTVLTGGDLTLRGESMVVTKLLERLEAEHDLETCRYVAGKLDDRHQRDVRAAIARLHARRGEAEAVYDAVPMAFRDAAMFVSLAEAAANADQPDAALKLAEFAEAAHERQLPAGRYDNSVCRAFVAAALAVSRAEDRQQDAEAWFDLAIGTIEVLPEDMRSAPWLWIAEALARTGRYGEALDIARSFEDTDLRSRCFGLIVAQQWRRGDAEQARQTTLNIEDDAPLAWALIDEARYHADRDDKAEALVALGRAATVLGRMDEQAQRIWRAGPIWTALIALQAELGEAEAAVRRIQAIADVDRIWALLTELMTRRAMQGDVDFVRAAGALIQHPEKMHWRARVVMSAELAAGHLQAVEASLADVKDPNDRCLYLLRLARAHAGRRNQRDVRRLVELASIALARVDSEYVGREALAEMTWLQMWLAATGAEHRARKVWDSIEQLSDPQLCIDLQLTAAAGVTQRLADRQPD